MNRWLKKRRTYRERRGSIAVRPLNDLYLSQREGNAIVKLKAHHIFLTEAPRTVLNNSVCSHDRIMNIFTSGPTALTIFVSGLHKIETEYYGP